MGYGFFPWVALLPVAFGRIVSKLGSTKLVARGQPDGLEPINARRKLDLFLLVWFVVTFATFTLIVTKFHHYVFPALPPLFI